MRIGFFTDTFLPQTNGVVNSIESFGSELAKRGHEVHVFAPKTSSREHCGMKIHSCAGISFRPYPEFKIGVPVKFKVPQLDIVHTHGPFSLGWYGLRVAKKQKIPRISTFHTPISEYVRYLSPFGKRTLQKLAWKYCFLHYNYYDAVITPSAAVRDMLTKVRVPIEVIPTGIDTDFFHPIAQKTSRKKLGITADRVLLYLGRISGEKKIETVIKAAPKNATLYVVGKGPALEKLKKSATSNVIFTGYVPNELVPYYYSAADFFVTASESETQGIVLAEAMACSAPVVAANALAVPEIVANGKNGFLFEPGNSAELAELMEKRCTAALRKNARATAEKYSKEKCTDKLEKFYESMLS